MKLARSSSCRGRPVAPSGKPGFPSHHLLGVLPCDLGWVGLGIHAAVNSILYWHQLNSRLGWIRRRSTSCASALGASSYPWTELNLAAHPNTHPDNALGIASAEQQGGRWATFPCRRRRDKNRLRPGSGRQHRGSQCQPLSDISDTCRPADTHEGCAQSSD